ncbi:MAG: N-carbamoylputrescine amidase [Verrucomicrobiales bacterium]|jgi:N-carbamoylputrescine amidase
MSPNPTKTVIGLVQTRSRQSPEGNVLEAERMIEKAAQGGATLVCLQELFSTVYFCQEENPDRFDLAEPFGGPLCQRMAAAAAKAGVVLIVPYFEKRAEGVYHNSAAIIDADGTILGQYRKMHIPDDPGFYEKYYFAPGDLGFRAWDTAAGRIGVCICWDQWFPEAARLTALHGAEILFYPTAIGWIPGERSEQETQAWEICQRAHGVSNGCFVAVANRTGHEAAPGAGIDFWGQSFLSAPDGRMLGQLSADDEDVLLVEIDRNEIRERRNHWPLLRDRRIDSYDQISERFIDDNGNVPPT